MQKQEDQAGRKLGRGGKESNKAQLAAVPGDGGRRKASAQVDWGGVKEKELGAWGFDGMRA